MDKKIVATTPDFPVMDTGGVLHIQSYSQSTEALLQFSQSTNLLAAICLQHRVKAVKQQQKLNRRDYYTLTTQ